MTAPEHDPAVSMWDAVIDRIRRNLFADMKCDEACRAGFMRSDVTFIPSEQMARLMKDGPDPAPGLVEMVRAKYRREHGLGLSDDERADWIRAKRRPDMPDRWEGDDS